MDIADVILAAEDLPRHPVAVPEWASAGTLYVRTLTALERGHFEAWCGEGSKGPDGKPLPVDIMTKAVIFATADEGGAPVFRREHLEPLKTKSGAVVLRIFNEVRRLNGMTEEEVEAHRKN